MTESTAIHPVEKTVCGFCPFVSILSPKVQRVHGLRLKKMVVHPLSMGSAWLTRASRLQPGDPAAPEGDCLPLLPPGPDGVHRPPPRRTRPSTSLSPGSPKRLAPREGIRPRYSGFRVQGTASSPSSTTKDIILETPIFVKERHPPDISTDWHLFSALFAQF